MKPARSCGVIPKYESVKSALRRRVNRMPAGSKLPAISTLCEDLEVSQGTVVRAIQELVDEGVVERRTNRGAFVPARDHARNVLVVWPDLVEMVTEQPLSVHPYTSTILHGLHEAAAESRRDLLVTRRLSGDEPGTVLGAGNVLGAVVLFNYDRASIESRRDLGIPTVLIEPLVRVAGVPFVATDHCTNTREATISLIRQGHSRVVYVAIDKHLRITSLEGHDEIVNYVVEERVRGYEMAMREAGLADLIYVHHAPGRLWTGQDRDELFSVLRDHGATACCCFNDDIAARVYHTYRERGMSIPQDLSVIGHDDAGLAKSIQPGLTTIHSPLKLFAQYAMTLLNTQIDSAESENYGIILASPLKERESVMSLGRDGGVSAPHQLAAG